MEKIGKQQKTHMFNNIKNSKEYWQDYYKTNNSNLTVYPSDFAMFVNRYYDIKNLSIIDLCCGNGRDTAFFSNLTTKSVVGIDQINIFNTFERENLNFIQIDIEDYINSYISEDLTYCRFGLHAIDEKLEDKIINWGKHMLAIEARSDIGTCPDGTHDRRLINGQKLLNKILNSGYKILYYNENTGLSKYKSEDPILIRLIATK